MKIFFFFFPLLSVAGYRLWGRAANGTEKFISANLANAIHKKKWRSLGFFGSIRPLAPRALKPIRRFSTLLHDKLFIIWQTLKLTVKRKFAALSCPHLKMAEAMEDAAAFH